MLLMSVTLLGLWPGNLTMVGLAQGEIKVRLDPLTSEVQVGDTISVDIVIEDVADLYGLDVRLSFDPALLEVQDADPGTAGVQIQKGTFPAPDFVVKNEADNGAGTIWYAVSQLGDIHPDPVSGSGVAASVTFKGLASGMSSVAFTYQKIVNRNGDEIPATTQDGQITVMPAGAAPTSTPTPKPKPTDTPPPTPTSVPPTAPPPTEAPTAVPPTATPTSRPTLAPTTVSEATEMAQPTPTAMPPTTVLPTETSAAAPPMATPTSRPTSALTTTSEATEVPLPTSTSTSVPAPTAQPEATEEETPSSTPFPTVLPSSTSGILAKSLPYVVVVFLGVMAVVAILAITRLRNR